MISGYCQGFLTIWWPRLYQFTKFLRFIVPIILHCTKLSIVEKLTSSKTVFEPDFPTVTCTICVSIYLLKFESLLLDQYTPSIRQIKSLFEVISQAVFVDIAVRLIEVPFSYFLHYICVEGYIANFTNKYLFVLHFVDGYLPVAKFIRLTKTEEGFQILRRAVAFIRILITSYKCDLHLPILCAISKVIYFVSSCWQLISSVFFVKKRKSRKRKYFLF